MALCSGTLRRYLLEHDALPDESLVAMVPVSIRTGDEEDIYPEPGVGDVRRARHRRSPTR